MGRKSRVDSYERCVAVTAARIELVLSLRRNTLSKASNKKKRRGVSHVAFMAIDAGSVAFAAS